MKQLIMDHMKETLLFAYLLMLSISAFAQTASLEEVFSAKREILETLWDVSLNRLEVKDLSNELSASEWDSFHEKKGIREVAALLIKDNATGEIKVINMQMGGRSSVSIYFNRPVNTTLLGRFHTHPYDYPSLSDLPFSPGDLVEMNRKDQLKEEFFSLIKSGKKYYAFVVEQPNLVKTYFTAQGEIAKQNNMTLSDFLYKKFYSINHGNSIQEIQLNSLLLITGQSLESGIGLYETIDGDWKKLN